MTNLFLVILNMSITASYVAAAVIITRLFLKRAPKIFSYMLWIAVAIRLVLPISFTSNFSIFNLIKSGGNDNTHFMEFIPTGIGLEKNPTVNIGISNVNQLINSSLPAATPDASLNPMQILLSIGTTIWITGIILLLIFSIISYLKLLRKINTATIIENNIYETDQINTPFVCGFFNPKIYFPLGMNKEEQSYILMHEQIHINRRDHLIKPFAFLLLVIHWFNPLMWISYKLMNEDMEMSCDETVVNKMGATIKKDYSTSLLTMSLNNKRQVINTPLAFGESDVKTRIKNILKYKKPNRKVVISYLIIIMLLVVGCTANSTPLKNPEETLYKGYDIDKLLDSKIKYIGGASNVARIINNLPIPDELEWNGMALQTSVEPYGLTMNYIITDLDKWKKNRQLNEKLFEQNSILLLSLIDNAGLITYTVTGDVESLEEQLEHFTVTRFDAEKLIGDDVRNLTNNKDDLKNLVDKVKFP